MRQLSTKRQRAIVRDVFNSEHDLVALASAHGLSPAQLADWASQPQTRRTLAGLCTLADQQTQLLLSRYRLVAVTRLIEQATGRDESVTAEQSRKACEALLRADLKRAGADPPDAALEDDSALTELRAAMNNNG